MPSISDKSTVDLIARLFTSNGRKQEKAMIDAEYSKAYAKSYCGKLWENPRLIAAIKAIDEESAAKMEVTKQSMTKQYDEDRAFARKHNSPSAACTASLNKARLYGMDKDNVTTTATTEQVKPEDKEVLDEACKNTKLRLG